MGFGKFGGGGFGAPKGNPLQSWAKAKAPAPTQAPGAPPPPGAPPHAAGAPPGPPAPPAAIYPPGHQPGKPVPQGGASCANCKWGLEMGEKTYCNEPNYVKWHGSAEVPAKSDSYVSDWWTDKAPAAAPPGTEPGAPPGPPGPPKPQAPPQLDKGPTG